ncbi:DUF5988 family protein [Kibdelosporangium phytohabitans]|nr:hypothetical protein [Kibdelosporangium phytohabitans]
MVDDVAGSSHEVWLKGGPPGISSTRHIDDGDISHVKVSYRAGLEHFEFSGEYREVESQRLPVCRWIYTTKVAE